MIRLVQRRLIIPRGDTGSFSLPVLPNLNTGNAAVFTIMDLMRQRKIYQKQITNIDGDTFTVRFEHEDTVNMPVGKYYWDIKFYHNPVIADNIVISGDEIDSYYAAFTLPECEVRQTGDKFLTADDVPTSKIDEDNLNLATAIVAEANITKAQAIASASEASSSAAEAEQYAINAAQSAVEAAESAASIVGDVDLARQYAEAAEASASAASSSEIAAAASELAALGYMTEASSSADNAYDYMVTTIHYEELTAASASAASSSEDVAIAAMNAAIQARNLASDYSSDAYLSASEAYQSELNAAASALAAANSAFAASSSELEAVAQATLAGQYASAASSSEDIAIQAKLAALEAQIAAELAMSEASSSATSAADSAAIAIEKANAASLSASAASSAENAAEEYATIATNKADAASHDAATAVSAATSAKNYAAMAISSASSAEYYASQLTGLDTAVNTLTPGSSATANYNPTTGVLTLGIPAGLKGEQGDAFHIVKTYASIEEMNSDYSGSDVEIGEFVMIASTVEDPDNAKVYIKGDQAFVFVVDMSGATGIQGVGIASIIKISSVGLVDTYRITYTDTTSSEYTVTNGVTPSFSIGTVTEATSADASITGTDANPVLNLVIPKLTKVSELQNDVGYLTTETDPTVPSWAKAESKPSYTASEVGALPDDTYIPTKVSDLENDSGYLTQHQDITGKADKVSSPTSGDFAALDSNGNLIDSGHKHSDYLISFTETDPTVPSWAKAENKPSYTASEIGAISTSHVVNDITSSDIAVWNSKYDKPSGGIPATDLASGVIPDLTNYVTKTDYATSSTGGVVKISNSNYGLKIESGLLKIQSNNNSVKSGQNAVIPVVATNTHIATFYGLAKAAGSDMSSSDNAVGTYTSEAKAAIQSMLGVENGVSFVETISGTTPTITGEPNVRYMCGEVSSISITPPNAGTIDVVFTSGTTVALLTVPSTVKWPVWFNATTLETNTIYEILITDGIYGSVMTWAV